jgi:phage terminase small subunit
MKPLTERQQKFVDALCELRDHRAAAEATGFSTRTQNTQDLLAKPHVRAAIEARAPGLIDSIFARRNPKTGRIAPRVQDRMLPPRQQRFIQEYVKCGVAKTAALAAGYSPRSAGKTGSQLLSNPRIQAVVKESRTNLAALSGYTAAVAMDELEEAMRYSKETGNATAFCRSVELRARLQGLLIERQDHRQIGSFSINISGIDHAPIDGAVVSALPPALPHTTSDDAEIFE